jgi:hypothetical protein
LASGLGTTSRSGAKVFWFFFSKKNSLFSLTFSIFCGLGVTGREAGLLQEVAALHDFGAGEVFAVRFVDFHALAAGLQDEAVMGGLLHNAEMGEEADGVAPVQIMGDGVCEDGGECAVVPAGEGAFGEGHWFILLGG